MRSSNDNTGRRKTQHQFIKDVRDSETAAHQMMDILNQLNPVQQIAAMALVQMSMNMSINRLDMRGEL